MQPNKLLLALSFAVLAFAADPELRISEGEAKKAAIVKSAPVYPPMARQLNITGRVEVEAVVGADGVVESVSIVAGNPILTKASVEAVKKWRFRPFETAGAPVRAIASLSFDFRQ